MELAHHSHVVVSKNVVGDGLLGIGFLLVEGEANDGHALHVLQSFFIGLVHETGARTGDPSHQNH